MTPTKSTAKIGGKDYTFTWGKLAIVRYTGISPDRRMDYGFAGIAQMAWAAVAEIVNPFPTWEHLASAVEQDEWQGLDAALSAILQKPESDPAQAEKKSDS